MKSDDWLRSAIYKTSTGDYDVNNSSDHPDLLWRIVTSDKAAIQEFIPTLWSIMYDSPQSMPTPEMVGMCRLFLLESIVAQVNLDEISLDENAINALKFVSAHCTDSEEEGALGNLRQFNPDRKPTDA